MSTVKPFFCNFNPIPLGDGLCFCPEVNIQTEGGRKSPHTKDTHFIKNARRTYYTNYVRTCAKSFANNDKRSAIIKGGGQCSKRETIQMYSLNGK